MKRPIIKLKIGTLFCMLLLTGLSVRLNAQNLADTARIDSLLEQASGIYKQGGAEEAIPLMYDGIELARKLKDHWRLSNLYLALGEDYGFVNRHDSALYYLQLAEEQGLAGNYADVYPYAQADLLGIFSKKRDKAAAQKLIDRMLQGMDALKDRSLKGTSYNQIGAFYSNMGYTETGLSYYMKALEQLHDTKDSLTKAVTSLNIGQVQNSLKRYDKAVSYYQLAKTALPRRKTENAIQIGGILDMVYGLTYEDWGKTDSAYQCFKQAISTLETCNNPLALCEAYSGLGRALALKNRFEAGKGMLNKALKAANAFQLTAAQEKVHRSFGFFYQQQRDWPQATAHYVQALALARTNSDPEALKSIYKSLYETSKATGNYAGALAYQQQYIAVSDSLSNINSINNLHELELKYQTARKEDQIALLEKQNAINNLTIKNSRRTVILLLIAASLIAALGFIVVYRNRIKRLQKEAYMRNRIAADLHDEVGSTLSSISLMTEMASNQLCDGPAKIGALLQKASSDARLMMENMDDIVWSINPQNDAFSNLEARIKEFALPLMENCQIAFSTSFTGQVDALRISMEQRRELYLLIKEALNNIAKYSQASQASLVFSRKEQHMLLTVTDNGVGFDPSLALAGRRNGLKGMYRRAATLRATLQIDSGPGRGTQISLVFPCS